MREYTLFAFKFHAHPSRPNSAHQLIIGQYYSKHDGVVGVDSAVWGPDLGPGTHLGTVPGLTQYVLSSIGERGGVLMTQVARLS